MQLCFTFFQNVGEDGEKYSSNTDFKDGKPSKNMFLQYAMKLRMKCKKIIRSNNVPLTSKIMILAVCSIAYTEM